MLSLNFWTEILGEPAITSNYAGAWSVFTNKNLDCIIVAHGSLASVHEYA